MRRPLLLLLALAAIALACRAALPRLWPSNGLFATYTEGTSVLLRRTEPFIDGDRGRWPKAVLGKRFSVAWEGTIVFPRARVQLAVEAQPGVRLFLDGRPIAVANFPYDHNRPGWPPPENLPPGKHALRVAFDAPSAEAPGRVRLLWVSAGRRGLPEYVPPGMLFPAPPGEVDAARMVAHFGRAGALALGALALWSALAIFLYRRELRAFAAHLWETPGRRRALGLAALICIGACILRLHDLSGAGTTWDEDVHRSAGLDYVLNLLAFDFRESSWRWIPEHPTVTMLFYGLPALFEDGFPIERAAAALAGVATTGFVIALGRRLFDLATGLLAGALFAVFPIVLALHKNVSHEAVVGLTWMAALCAYLRALDRRTTRAFVGAGLCAGLAVASRATSGILVPISIALYALSELRRPRGERLSPVQPLVLVWAVAFASFVLVWPYLWTGTLAKIRHMFGVHGTVQLSELYFGHFLQRPPWHYLFVYFGITTPALVLFAVLVGIGRAARSRRYPDGVVVAWFLGAFLVALGPAIKDGIRYAFPAFGAAAILAARACLWVPRGPLVGALLWIYALASVLRVHPYYLDYFNELVGGPGRVHAKKQFETSWWGEGLAASTAYVDRHAPPGASIWLDAEPKHVMVWRDDLVRKDAPGADFVVHNDTAYTPPFATPGYEKVFEAQAAGAVMSQVWRRKP